MRRYLVRLLPAVAFIAAGCGGSVKLVPAEGILTINGKPAANVSIQFMPDAMSKMTGPTSYAVSDTEGKFRLKTYDGQDGAVAGTHLVVLADMEEERTPQGQKPKRQFPSRLDPKYIVADPKNGLRAEVTGSAPIELKATGPK